MVGDIVYVKSKMTEYNGCEAQVVKVPSGTGKVGLRMQTGPETGNTWLCHKTAEHQLIMPSTNDPGHPSWAERKKASLLAALSKSGASSTSAASVQGSAASAQKKTVVPPLDTKGFAKAFFGDMSDDDAVEAAGAGSS